MAHLAHRSRSAGHSQTQPRLRLFAVRRAGCLIPLSLVLVVVTFAPITKLDAGLDRSSASANSRIVAMLGPMVVVALLGAIMLWLLYLIAGTDHHARSTVSELGTDPSSRELLERWAIRTAWYRRMGGLFASVLWFFTSKGMFDLGRLFVMAMIGVFVGSIVAERHRYRGGRGPRCATLQTRSVRQYLDPVERRRATVLAMIWIGWVAISVFVPQGSSVNIWPYAAAGLSVLGLAHLVQRRVVSRAQPHLPHSLKDADDLARRLAVTRSLGRTSNIVALVLFSSALDGSSPVLGQSVASIISGAAFLLALWWWWKNRHLALSVPMLSTS